MNSTRAIRKNKTDRSKAGHDLPIVALPMEKRRGIPFLIKPMTYPRLFGKLERMHATYDPASSANKKGKLEPWDFGQGDGPFCFSVADHAKEKAEAEVEHEGHAWVLAQLVKIEEDEDVADIKIPEDEDVAGILRQVVKSPTKQFWIRKNQSVPLEDVVPLPTKKRDGVHFLIKSYTHSGLCTKIQSMCKGTRRGKAVEPWDLGQGDDPFCFSLPDPKNKSLLEVEHMGQTWVLVHLVDPSQKLVRLIAQSLHKEDVAGILRQVVKSPTKQFWICKNRSVPLEDIVPLPTKKRDGVHFLIKSYTHGGLYKKLQSMCNGTRGGKVVEPWDLGQGDDPFCFSLPGPKNKSLLEVEYMGQAWVLIHLIGHEEEDVAGILSQVVKSPTKQFWIRKSQSVPLEDIVPLSTKKREGIPFVIMSFTHGGLHKKLQRMCNGIRGCKAVESWNLGQGDDPFCFSMTGPKNKSLLEVEHMGQMWVLATLIISPKLASIQPNIFDHNDEPVDHHDGLVAV